MAIVKPFYCIRPVPGLASRIAALPYDVYNRREAKQEVEREPLSFLKIDRAETQFEDSVDMYDERVYRQAHDTLWEMVSRGDFLREEQKCFYVYELTMDGRVQDGLVACVSIDDYENGVVKKHEDTREEKEQDRIRHVDACDAQTGPVFLAYRFREDMRVLIKEAKGQEPLYDFVSSDGIRHRVFRIGEEDRIRQISDIFAEIPQLYIADGHHRGASAVKVGRKRRAMQKHPVEGKEYESFLSVLFADDQLKILDYNRVVKDLNGYSVQEFQKCVGDIFDVEPIAFPQEEDNILPEEEEGAATHRPSNEDFSEGGQREQLLKSRVRPREKGEFAMLLQGKWYRLRVREQDRSTHPVDGLDVSILQEKLLAPVLGVEDPRTDGRIDFVGGIRGLVELERRARQDCAVAFAMYPTQIGELFAVADAGLLMPPKSTWFEPKLRSGLFIHEI